MERLGLVGEEQQGAIRGVREGAFVRKEGRKTTRRQVGKPLVVKAGGNWWLMAWEVMRENVWEWKHEENSV